MPAYSKSTDGGKIKSDQAKIKMSYLEKFSASMKLKRQRKKMKPRKKDNHIDKVRKIKGVGEVHEDRIDEVALVGEDCSRGRKGGGRSKGDKAKISAPTSSQSESIEEPKKATDQIKIKTKKVKKEKSKKKDVHLEKENDIEKMPAEVDEEKVDEMSSVDEDCSKGMKKWLIKYRESRLGLKILQQRIDDFITSHEEKLEQERKEREVLAAEGGWTVVVHHKGRKKTTDAETGVTVGSVAQAAVVDKLGKKKTKEAPIDFYRFQRREARRNEVMMLQSKFEQDKKRIQQLRAARKFRPY